MLGFDRMRSRFAVHSAPDVVTTAAESNAGSPAGRLLSRAELGRLVQDVAAAEDWIDQVMFCTDQRWFHRLELSAQHEIWLLSWLPSQHTGFHDHGEAAGAFAVVQGELLESVASHENTGVQCRRAVQGTVRTFGGQHVHDMRNICAVPAISLHAYSPPLASMRRFEMTASGLALVRTDHAELDW